MNWQLFRNMPLDYQIFVAAGVLSFITALGLLVAVTI
jgi:hypothetical protein